MRIVISSYTFLPELGGVATHVATLATAFAAAGHRATVITTTPGSAEGYGFTVIRSPNALALARHYLSADILILSNLSLKLLYPLLAMSRRFGLWHHSESALGARSSRRLADAPRKWVMARAVHFATSRYIAEKVAIRNATIIHPFIGPRHLAEACSIPEEERRGVLFAGRLEPEKGLLYLIERWQLVRERLGVSELRIAGAGSLHERIAARAAARPDGICLLGPLSMAETAREMGKAQYCIVPSLWSEPFGSVALEAIAAGATTICTRRGGLPEAAGDLAVFFDPECPASFEAALDSARARVCLHQADPVQRNAYQAAVARHVAKFDPAMAVETTIAVFDKYAASLRRKIDKATPERPKGYFSTKRTMRQEPTRT